MARRKIEGQALPKLAFPVEEPVYSLGLSETKIRELIDNGELGSIREGTAVLVTLDQAMAYLKRKHADALCYRNSVSATVENEARSRASGS